MQAQPGLIEVVDVVDPFPGLRRVAFAGERLSHFPVSCAAGHIKLFFPNTPDEVPELPHRDAQGRKVWPSQRPVTRTYSVRAFDPSSHRLVVDFVLHEAPGHASDWARAARRGLRIGIAGPALPEVLTRTAPWNLFVGDLSALPMISALIENLPESTHAEALLELPTHRPVSFVTRARLTVTQRLGHRGDALVAMVKRVEFPAARHSVRVCVAGESEVTVAIRRYLEHAVGLPRASLYTVPYWKHAATEEEYHQERHTQMDAMETT